MHEILFDTLADSSRRRVLDALRSGEQSVNDIVKAVGIHQSGVSRHLRILQDAGFVVMRPLGQKRLYSLRAEPFEQLGRWLDDYRQAWEARLDRFGAALDARQARNKGE